MPLSLTAALAASPARRLFFARVLLHGLLLLPLSYFFYLALTNDLGPDPAEYLSTLSGDWSLRILLLTLAVSPLYRLLRWPTLMRLRRPLGLYAFFYALLHLLVYLWLHVGLSLELIIDDLIERRYLQVGTLSFVMLLALAVTSPLALRRRMGRQWLRLHKLIYPAAALVLLHMLLQLRSDATELVVYSAIFAALMLWRLPRYSLRKLARER